MSKHQPPASDGPARGLAARHAEPHTLVGAYAMDAVGDEDRAVFERHLAGCESCRAEVRGLREATARLAAAAQVRPRAELRDQTVHAAGLIRQLPPVTADDPAGQTAASRTSWRRAFSRAFSRRTVSAHAGRRVLALLAGTGRPASWLPRLAVVMVAALVVVAVGFGTAMHGADHRLDMAQRRSGAIAAVLGAPDAIMLTAQVTIGGSATVVMSHRDGELVFTAADLPALSGGKSYQLWLVGPGGSRSAGVLPPARHGMAGPMVVSGLAAGDKVGLTVEPARGVTRPSSRPILMLPL